MKNLSYAVFISILSFFVVACDHGSNGSQDVNFAGKSVKLAEVPMDCEVGDASFNPQGHGVEIIVTKEKKQAVYTDTGLGPFYEAVREPLFSKGTGYAYIAVKDGKERVVTNKEEGPAYDNIGNMIFSPKGQIIYTAMRSGKWKVVSGNNASENYDGITSPPIVTTDGGKIAFVAKLSGSAKSNLVVCNSKLTSCVTGKEYDSVSPIRADSSGLHLSYVGDKGGQQSLVTVNLQETGLKETESKGYDAIHSFEVAEGGGYVAFLASRGKGKLLVKNGVEMPVQPFDSTFDIAVSKQGKVIHTAMVKNSVHAYVDGKPVGAGYAEVTSPVFSSDGGHYAYVAKKGEKFSIAVDGKEGPTFDMVVDPRFSPDGTKIVYRARNNGERFVVVGNIKDGAIREHPHYEAVWNVSFSPDGKSVGYGIRNSRQFWWKHENL